MLDKLKQTPGVHPASLSRFAITRDRYNVIGPRYFETMGVRFLRGRDFSSADTAASHKVAIISDGAAREFFPGEDPIGRALPGGFERIVGGSAEIVGVVVRNDGLRRGQEDKRDGHSRRARRSIG